MSSDEPDPVAILTIPKKPQVTIPKEVRDFLKLDEGDRMIFYEKKGELMVKKGRAKVSKASGSF